MFQSRKGIGVALAVLIIIAGLTVGAVLLLSQIGLLYYFVGIKTTVGLIVDIDDEGTRINSLLVTDKGSGRYSEILGLASVQGSQVDTEDIEKSLEILDVSLVVNEGERRVFQGGDVVGDGLHIDFPLPGLKKGRIGIDAGI